MAENLKKAYHTVMDDHFPDRMEIAFVSVQERQTLVYEKVSWVIDGVCEGLREGGHGRDPDGRRAPGPRGDPGLQRGRRDDGPYRAAES